MDILQKEELRRLCLRFFAERSALPFSAQSVHTRISLEIRCTIPEVEDAVFFLHSSGLLDEVENRMGGTRYFRVNAKGILSYETGF